MLEVIASITFLKRMEHEHLVQKDVQLESLARVTVVVGHSGRRPMTDVRKQHDSKPRSEIMVDLFSAMEI